MKLIKDVYAHGGLYSFGRLIHGAIINAYCIAKMAYRQQGMKGVAHLEFRKALYRELFKHGSETSISLHRNRRHSSFQPSNKGNHEVERIRSRKWCHFGVVRVQRVKARGHTIPKQIHTVYCCKACKVPVCRPDIRPC